jgi:hypothetical protein
MAAQQHGISACLVSVSLSACMCVGSLLFNQICNDVCTVSSRNFDAISTCMIGIWVCKRSDNFLSEDASELPPRSTKYFTVN